jgi:predicted hotdog family 3-hydroxylacyl-ACP dehydratase
MDIEALIPHRGRMKLIDEILTINTDIAVTCAKASDHWPLYQESFVDPIILIEIVAQTAAIHISWKSKSLKDSGGKGWLVGVKSADFFLDQIPVDTVLISTVRNLDSIDNYNVVNGEVKIGMDIVSRITIQVLRSGQGDI